MTLCRSLGAVVSILLLLTSVTHAKENREYLLIGVSGGLQDGFPDHNKLDYHAGQPDESKAIFLGRALVRGYKAYLDVMQEGWRQYTPEPAQPLINSNVFATGCSEHANQYWVYIVDARQYMMILNNEPRFLSITPDTGLLDLKADETHSAVRDFMVQQAKSQQKSNLDNVAIPLVTAVWYHNSHVPSPSIRVLPDDTHVTNFPDSLALWANVNDADRIAVSTCQASGQCDATMFKAAQSAEQRYWSGIRKAIRAAEENRPTSSQLEQQAPYHYKCKKKTRFGVDKDTARVNSPISAEQLTSTLRGIGYHVDYAEGELRSLLADQGSIEVLPR